MSAVILDDLEPCAHYLVVVTAIDCNVRVESEPNLIGDFVPPQSEHKLHLWNSYTFNWDPFL